MPFGSISAFLTGKGSGSTLAKLVRQKNESFWIKKGEREALSRFHRAAETVPAYRKFLKQHGIRSQRIHTITDFASVPETSKENYIRKFSLEERSPEGSFAEHRIVAASSGTTGAPTLWPRGEEQESEAAAVHEFLFTDLYELDRYRTLLIIGFPMGVYVSGVATALPSFLTSLRHQNLTILTAGNNKESILTTLPGLMGAYQQIILAGHPFFVKDIIEAGRERGIRWPKIQVRTFFVSEGFSEQWREYVASAVGAAPERDMMSIYGTSEFLLIGYESPESILVRKAAERHARFRLDTFRTSITPYLFHYNPALRYLETNPKGELLCTAWSGIPLIRFNLHDAGSIILKDELRNALSSYNISLKKALTEVRWRPWNLPYVALYGRSDHALILYAANIYPEHVHAALEDSLFFRKLTGKFTMEKRYTKNRDQEFLVHIELRKNVRATASFAAALERCIESLLKSANLEYRDAAEHLGKDMRPRVILHPFNDPRYFPLGLKPRYIKA